MKSIVDIISGDALQVIMKEIDRIIQVVMRNIETLKKKYGDQISKTFMKCLFRRRTLRLRIFQEKERTLYAKIILSLKVTVAFQYDFILCFASLFSRCFALNQEFGEHKGVESLVQHT